MYVIELKGEDGGGLFINVNNINAIVNNHTNILVYMTGTEKPFKAQNNCYEVLEKWREITMVEKPISYGPMGTY